MLGFRIATLRNIMRGDAKRDFPILCNRSPYILIVDAKFKYR